MRRVFSTFTALFVAGSFLAGSALAAEPLSAKQAKKLLFKGDQFAAQMIEDAPVDAGTMAQVEALVTLLQDPKLAAQFATFGYMPGYYGAVAVQPGQPLSEKSMSISAHLHNPTAAMAAAVAGCDALPGPNCVAVALIVPKRFKPRAFSLNQAASSSFFDDWRDGDGPKFLAYSPSTHGWAIGKGAGSEAVALESCNEQAAEVGKPDCVIGIAEP